MQASHRRFQVLALSKIYSSITIPQLASLTSTPQRTPSPDETAAYVSSLIASGTLNATLVPSTTTTTPPILRFHDKDSRTGPLAKSEATRLAELEAQAAKVKTLDRHVKDTQRRLELSKEWLHAERQHRKQEVEREMREKAGAGSEAMPGAFGGGEDDMLQDL